MSKVFCPHLLALLALLMSFSHAYVIGRLLAPHRAPASSSSFSPTVVSMSSPEGAASGEEEVETEGSPAATNEEESEEEEEQEPEDAELVALKEEIAQMEDTLKQRRRKLADTEDAADGYTKTGYARKVAEMENMRRARGVS